MWGGGVTCCERVFLSDLCCAACRFCDVLPSGSRVLLAVICGAVQVCVPRKRGAPKMHESG